MNKKERKLINDVAKVIKVISENSYHKPVKVVYDFSYRGSDYTDCRAFIYAPTENLNTGNGFERTYGWKFLRELSDLDGISYHIGQTDAVELHIQVYVK